MKAEREEKKKLLKTIETNQILISQQQQLTKDMQERIKLLEAPKPKPKKQIIKTKPLEDSKLTTVEAKEDKAKPAKPIKTTKPKAKRGFFKRLFRR